MSDYWLSIHTVPLLLFAQSVRTWLFLNLYRNFVQEQLQEYLAEKKRWMDDRYKKTPSQEALHQKIKERYEQHLFNKYFLKQDDQSPNETINSSSEVLEQTLALEATLNSTLNSLFDPNSSVRLRPLYETLPPRSGYSTVPGENDAEEIDDAVQEQFRRGSLVADEINKRGQSVSGNSGSSSAHTTEVRERVLAERMEGVKKVTSAAKVVGKLKKKMSKQLMSRTLPVCYLEFDFQFFLSWLLGRLFFWYAG